jgi:hypothetical protein
VISSNLTSVQQTSRIRISRPRHSIGPCIEQATTSHSQSHASNKRQLLTVQYIQPWKHGVLPLSRACPGIEGAAQNSSTSLLPTPRLQLLLDHEMCSRYCLTMRHARGRRTNVPTHVESSVRGPAARPTCRATRSSQQILDMTILSTAISNHLSQCSHLPRSHTPSKGYCLILTMKRELVMNCRLTDQPEERGPPPVIIACDGSI